MSTQHPGTSLHVVFYQTFPHVSTARDKHWGELGMQCAGSVCSMFVCKCDAGSRTDHSVEVVLSPTCSCFQHHRDCLQSALVSMCVCGGGGVLVCVHVCMCTCLCMCQCVCVCVCTCVHVYMSVYVSVHVCVCVHVCVLHCRAPYCNATNLAV